MAAVARIIDRGYGEQKLAVCLVCAKNIDDKNSISKYSEFFWGGNTKFEQETKILICPRCGYKLEDVLNTCFVGCKDCYKLFADDIKLKLAKMQGKNVHVGKVPLSITNGQDKAAKASASLMMARALEDNDIDLAKLARKHFPNGFTEGI